MTLERWAMACAEGGAGETASGVWLDIPGPMPVAAALRALGKWNFDVRRDFDAETWWFRARFVDVRAGDRLHLDGLATLAEVFVDGVSVLSSSNMYHAHIVALPAGATELTIRFDALAPALAARRPRPRWKTRLVAHQQLRWIRTTLVGRMPGWSPPVALVGPWRGVWVERGVAMRSGAPAGVHSIPQAFETDRDLGSFPRDTLTDPAAADRSSERISAGMISFNTGEIPAFIDSERNQSEPDARISLSTAEYPAVREVASEAMTRRLAPGELESAVAAGPRESKDDDTAATAGPPVPRPDARDEDENAALTRVHPMAVDDALADADLVGDRPVVLPEPPVVRDDASVVLQPVAGALDERAALDDRSIGMTAPPVQRPSTRVPTSRPSTRAPTAPLDDSAVGMLAPPIPAGDTLDDTAAALRATPASPIAPGRRPALESPAAPRDSSSAAPRFLLGVSVAGGAGVVTVDADLAGVLATADAATLVVGESRQPLAVDGLHVRGRLEIPDVELWWPHTHGAQPRYPAAIETTGGRFELGLLAFRTATLDAADKRFVLSINGIPIFCRGAVWTSLDVVTLTGMREEYRRVLTTARDAGMNMLRLSGTLFYEDDAFYEICDELGILVWQDFMFANMDYPATDEAWSASVEREARELLGRLQSRACVVVLCGGSEVEQQAAMFGAPREIWRSSLFAEQLPSIVQELRPDTPYWFNSPANGPNSLALPFHVDEGAGHYYGVGAYLRPFDDARRANVKFASECLAFANIPEDDLFPSFLADGQAPFVSAKWKERTSKDNGSGWDFEDVRDHYVQRLFDVDPARLRYEDMERYLALGRVAAGEAMRRTFAEFRREGSPTSGALVWFLQDLWPGAGWGLLDARGEPKSVYWYAKRVMQPLGLFLLDEGVNGLQVHLRNDGPTSILATLEVTLYRDGETRTAGGQTPVRVPARGALSVSVDAILPTFSDSAHAYRFGPSGHDVAVATLLDAGGSVLTEAVHVVDFAKPPPCVGLEGTLAPDHVIVTTRRFAQAVRIAVPGHVPADNYFDLAPGRTRTIALRPIPNAKKRSTLAGELSALNLRAAVPLR